MPSYVPVKPAKSVDDFLKLNLCFDISQRNSRWILSRGVSSAQHCSASLQPLKGKRRRGVGCTFIAVQNTSDVIVS